MGGRQWIGVWCAVWASVMLASCGGETETGGGKTPTPDVVASGDVADVSSDAGDNTPDGSDDEIAASPCAGLDNGTPCDDGNACTVDDVCSGGVCVGGSTETCGSEEPCVAGVCDPEVGCTYAPKADGSACTRACFGTATCQAGVCEPEPESAVACPASDDPCVTEWVCDPDTAACTKAVFAVAETPCDADDDLCTLDQCDGAGTCAATGGVETCDAQSAKSPCWTWTCSASKGCLQTAFIEGASCTDNNACTSGDTCVKEGGQQLCIGQPLVVDDGNPCTDDSCAGGNITHTPLDGVACDPQSPCSATGTCNTGSCEPTTPCECEVASDCPAPVSPCVAAVCSAGTCGTEPANNGGSCDDADACTENDVCNGGSCMGVAVAVDDGDACTADSCAAGVISHEPLTGTACDSDDVCTETATCQAGSCVADQPCPCAVDEDCEPLVSLCEGKTVCGTVDGKPACVVAPDSAVVCEATGSPCTENVCVDGACELQDATGAPSCDDGDPCTTDDICAAGSCAGVPMLCNVPGTCQGDGYCADGDCIYPPADDGTGCDDADTCTENDQCVGGSCVGAPLDLDDGNACTADACVDGEVSHMPLTGTACDSEDVCTETATCQSGQCVPDDPCPCTVDDDCAPLVPRCDGETVCGTVGGKPACVVAPDSAIVCEATSSPCTENVCVDGGCELQNAPGSPSCDDGDACTEADTCAGGSCAGTAVEVDDADPCTADACVDGVISHEPASGASCVSDDPCTPAGTCSDGVCLSNAPCECTVDDDCDSLGPACAGATVCELVLGVPSCQLDESAAEPCPDTGNPCTESVCTEVGCSVQDVSGACDDGNPCTSGSLCGAGACQPGAAVGDGTPCPDGVCTGGVCGGVQVTQTSRLAMGANHVCVVRTGGTLACWGANDYGQLGLGRVTPNRTIPTDVEGIETAEALVAAEHRTCVLSEGGPMACWGNNTFGTFATGDEVDAAAPTPSTELGLARAVCAAPTFACAVLGTGQVVCWGSNVHDQFGGGSNDGSSLAPVVVPGVSGAMGIACGQYHACAVLGSGQVQCWGHNAYGQAGQATGLTVDAPTLVPGVSDATAVTAGERHTCALRGTGAAAGTVLCWGDGDYGQLGVIGADGENPVEVAGISDATGVTGGARFTCALRETGQVSCWGRGNEGQLGDGNGASADQPVAVTGIDSAVAIAASEHTACALLGDETVRCWGDNFWGQLGDGTTNDSLSPVAVRLGDRICAACDDQNPCTIDTCDDGCVPILVPDGTPCAVGLRCVSGVCSDPAPPVTSPVGAGYDYNLFQRPDGTVAGAGENDDGQLGLGDTWPPVVVWPRDVPGLVGVRGVAAGDDHACAVDDQGQVWCWGDGNSGRLGQGDALDHPSPTLVSLPAAAVDVRAGARTTCALLADGRVACWGWNLDGETGDGTGDHPVVAPVFVLGLEDAVQVDVGETHACATRAQGRAVCWGNGVQGRLGNGLPYDSDQPVDVAPGTAGFDFIASIHPGNLQTCAIEVGTGRVACWGSNADGAAGQTSSLVDDTPQLVDGLSGIQWLDARYKHTCAVDGAGALWCWGSNTNGEIGDGTGLSADLPTSVSLPPVARVSVGRTGTCVSLIGGGYRCWGANFDGQLGTGTTASEVHSPVTPQISEYGYCEACDDAEVCTHDTCDPGGCMSSDEPDGLGCGINSVCALGVCTAGSAPSERIAAGRVHTCFVRVGGQVACWGDNGQYQLGGSIADESEVPSPTGVTADAVASWDDHTCARYQGNVTCWGANSSGQLGAGHDDPSVTPLAVPELQSGDVAAIATGENHSCALLTSGQVSCWGGDLWEELGNADVSGEQPSPGPVADLTDAIALTAGAKRSCVISSGGSASCWGDGASSALGDGQTFERHRPMPVAPGVDGVHDWAQLVMGADHACGLTLDGQVACWGSNGYDKLGQGGGSSKVPQLVPGLTGVVRLAAGADHTCALRSDQTVWCWGRNSSGQIGNGSTSTPDGPTQVTALTGVTEIAAGGSHSCALVGTADALWCWGSNSYGQLGSSVTSPAKEPVLVVWP